MDCEQENVFLLMTDVSSEVRVTIRISYSVSGSSPRNMYLIRVNIRNTDKDFV